MAVWGAGNLVANSALIAARQPRRKARRYIHRLTLPVRSRPLRRWRQYRRAARGRSQDQIEDHPQAALLRPGKQLVGIVAILDTVHGARRENLLVALRSLLSYCKKNGTIFRDPTSRIKAGQKEYGVLQSLQPDEVDRAIVAATTPASRLVLALAAVHAARSKTIRELLLDDVDLGNRRIVIGGRIRPLDNLTDHVLLAWLHHRRTRWPNTANPHLLINQQTARDTGPGQQPLDRDRATRPNRTLERLRVDRQLEEALVHGGDPLHLAAIFGLDVPEQLLVAICRRAHIGAFPAASSDESY